MIANQKEIKQTNKTALEERGINFDIGVPCKKYFESELIKYSYMWKEGGEFSQDKYK